LSGKEQTARWAVAHRGFATQTGEILAEIYGYFAIEASMSFGMLSPSLIRKVFFAL